MTHRLTNPNVQNHLTKGLKVKVNLTSKIKLYSLFRKDVAGHWIRVSDNAYSEVLAYRVFTERLLVNPIAFAIRPIKIVSLEAR